MASNPAAAQLPAGLRGTIIYALSRIEEIAKEIKKSSGSLSDFDQEILIAEYYRIGVPVDQLLLQSGQLSLLTKQFKKLAKRIMASEELVRTLLRLRKSGKLRPSAASKRPKVN